MQLTLTVLRCPDAVAPETRSVSGGEFSVGRGPGVDWVLPDPDRVLSKRHFAVAFRGGIWQLADTSTNGTYLNRDAAPLGNGEVRNLRDGDRLRVGAYEIEARLIEDAVAISAAPSPASRGSMGSPQAGGSPFGDPFGMDPFAPAKPERNPFDEPAAYRNFGTSQTAAQLPHDFDPLAPDPGEVPYHGPTQADHSSVMDDAFRPPQPIGQMPLHSGGVIPGDDLLPDDWDKDLLEGISPPASPAPGPPPASVRPVQQVEAPRPAQPVQRVVPAAEPAAPPPSASEFAPATPTVSPFEEPAPAASAVSLQAKVQDASQPARTVDDGALLTAFLEGVGLPDAHPADAAATMRALGKAFRELVSGLRAVLIARASIKSEFRIEQTMIRAQGNNPLKFSAGDDDALAALLGTGRRTDMTPHDAVADALRDIRLHELASMAAMQSAVRAMLDGLDPAKLRAAAEQGGGMTLLPAQKKARAWDSYEALHARTVQALADDFDSAFGKAFARAYETALNEVSAKERR